MSASTTVNAASCAHSFRAWLQPYIFRIESNGTIFQNIAWNAHIADGLRLIERRMGIPKIQELFQVTNVLSDINHFEIGIAFDLLFHIFAVRAGVHYVHLYHRYGVFSLARQIYKLSTRLLSGREDLFRLSNACDPSDVLTGVGRSGATFGAEFVSI